MTRPSFVPAVRDVAHEFQRKKPARLRIGKRKLDDVIQMATVVDCYNESHPESDLARGIPTRTRARFSGGNLWGQLSLATLAKPPCIKRLAAECESLPFHQIEGERARRFRREIDLWAKTCAA